MNKTRWATMSNGKRVLLIGNEKPTTPRLSPSEMERLLLQAREIILSTAFMDVKKVSTEMLTATNRFLNKTKDIKQQR